MANSVLYVVSVNGRDAPISPNLMKKQTHPYLGWPAGELIFSIFSCVGELFL